MVKNEQEVLEEMLAIILPKAVNYCSCFAFPLFSEI